MTPQLLQRNRDGAGYMARAILFWRAHVKHNDLRTAYTLQKSLLFDWLHRFAPVIELAHDRVDLSEAALGYGAQRLKEVADLLISKAVCDEKAFLARIDQSRRVQ